MERGRDAEPFGQDSGWASRGVSGRRGGEGASSAQRQETLRKTGWKEEASATTGCNVRKAAAPGAGQGRGAHRSRPRLPYSRWPRAQELPEVGDVERTYARSPCPQLRVRGIPKVEGPLCQVRCQVACFLRLLTGSENPANRGRNPDDPVPPRPAPPLPSRPVSSPPPPGRDRPQASSLLHPHPAGDPH